MQGQCTRCRWPWGGHGKGRRAAAGVGSSYLVRSRLVGRGLHSQPFCCAGWLTCPSGHHCHWASAGALALTGIPGPSKRGSASKGRLAAGVFVSVPLPRPLYARPQVAFQSILPTEHTDITVVDRKKQLCSGNGNCNCKGSGFARDLVLLADTRGRGLLVRQLR